MARILERLSRIGVAASSSRWGGIVYYVVCRRIDSILIPLTGARMSMGPPGFTTLVTTRGARTGKPRKTSLAFLWKGDGMVVVASKGGAPHHPAWYHNMKANPRVRVQHRGGIEERVAREATGEERESLFAEVAARYPNFAAYQERASQRVIPVMVLSRS